jgi:hypothetical protein
MPAQQRARRHEPAHPQRPGEQPRPGGQHHRLPSPASAQDPAAATPRLRSAAPATRHPSTPRNAPAAPSNQPGGRASSRAPVPSQACDAASPTTSTAGESAGQPPMRHFGTLTPHSRPFTEADQAPARLRRSHQRIRTSRIKAQLNTGSRV